MSDLIPAAPGWYLRSEPGDATLPIIAWLPSADGDAPTLLPFVPDNRGCSPTLINLAAPEERAQEWQVVYLPNHDPQRERPAAGGDLTPRLNQLGHDARDLWLAGATQHDVVLHIAISIGGWTRTDENHLGLLAALAKVRERIETTTPV
jgi:hypothetical protein